MKVIAFSTSIFPNGNSPMADRLYFYMKSLQMEGAFVEIVMPSFEIKMNGIYEGIPYSFVKVINQRNKFSERKVVREFAAIFYELAQRCDVIFTSEDTNYSIREITKAVQSAGCKIVIELNENPYSIKASRTDFQPLMKLNRQFFLNYTLPKVDGVITISHSLYKLVEKYRGNVTEVIRVPILSEKHEIRKNIKMTGIPYILHAGALSEKKDGVKAMLKAFLYAHKRLERNLKFIFTNKTGFPSLLDWIDHFIHENQLENYVEFRGLVSKTELNDLYNNCSLAIINKPSNSQNNYNFPTKLTELLPRGIPLVISKTGELVHYFTDNENAYMVDANDVQQIAEKIIQIINNPQDAARIGRNGSILAEREFQYTNHSKSLFSFFQQVSQKATN